MEPMLKEESKVLLRKNEKMNTQTDLKNHENSQSRQFKRLTSKERSFALMLKIMENSDGTVNIKKLENGAPVVGWGWFFKQVCLNCPIVVVWI